MRQLLLKSALVAPLLLGVAVLCFGGTKDHNRLPGRDVGSTEARAVLGGSCYYLKSASCTGVCSGTKATGGTQNEYEEETTGGCSTDCDASALGSSCNGG